MIQDKTNHSTQNTPHSFGKWKGLSAETVTSFPPLMELSGWSMWITWLEYCYLVGQSESRDYNTTVRLVRGKLLCRQIVVDHESKHALRLSHSVLARPNAHQTFGNLWNERKRGGMQSENFRRLFFFLPSCISLQWTRDAQISQLEVNYKLRVLK